MLRLIDADALRIRLEKSASDNDLRSMLYVAGIRAAIRIVREFPTIDPESLREKAYWKPETQNSDILFECSHCGCQISTDWGYDPDDMWNYCPACGARTGFEEE